MCCGEKSMDVEDAHLGMGVLVQHGGGWCMEKAKEPSSRLKRRLVFW